MNNFRACVLMVVSMGLFSLEDVIVKRVSAELPAGQIFAMIGGIGVVILSLVAWLRGESLLTRAVLSWPMLVRNASEAVGSLSYVVALTLIPVSLASVILQSTPLLVTMGAALFLGEQVGRRRWTAIAVGLAGVILVLQPGTEGFRPEALWAVLGVLGMSLRDLMTRLVPPAMTTLQVTAWAFLVGVPTGLLALGPDESLVMPSPRVMAELLLGICLGLAAYGAIVASIRGGSLSVVAPFRYSRVVFALILGAIVFGERPDTLMLLGAALIVGSGLYALAREARSRRREARPSPGPRPPL